MTRPYPIRATSLQFRTPQEFAEEVAFWTEDFPAPNAVVPLREALERGSSRWIGAFREADGVSGLCGVSDFCDQSGCLEALAAIAPPPPPAVAIFFSPKQAPDSRTGGRIDDIQRCLTQKKLFVHPTFWLFPPPPATFFVDHRHPLAGYQVMEALAESRDLHLEEGDSINPQKVSKSAPSPPHAPQVIMRCRRRRELRDRGGNV